MKAIVIEYQGMEPSQFIAEQLASIVKEVSDNNIVEVHFISDAELAKQAAQIVTATRVILDPVEEAAKLINETYLSTGSYSPIALCGKMCNDVQTNNHNLKSAIAVLASQKRLDPTIIGKYGINREVKSIIDQVSNYIIL